MFEDEDENLLNQQDHYDNDDQIDEEDQ